MFILIHIIATWKGCVDDPTKVIVYIPLHSVKKASAPSYENNNKNKFVFFFFLIIYRK